MLPTLGCLSSPPHRLSSLVDAVHQVQRGGAEARAFGDGGPCRLAGGDVAPRPAHEGGRPVVRRDARVLNQTPSSVWEELRQGQTGGRTGPSRNFQELSLVIRSGGGVRRASFQQAYKPILQSTLTIDDYSSCTHMLPIIRLVYDIILTGQLTPLNVDFGVLCFTSVPP